jgi:hypothetical protein
MPRIRVRERVSQKTEDGNVQVILFLLFWLALLVECVALYKRHYTLYGFSRMLLVPILLSRSLLSQSAGKISLYFYLFLLFSLSADVLTIFGNERVAYVGLNLFTVGYLSVGCYFQQLRDNHNNSHLVFIITAIFIASATVLWLYAPEIHKQTFYLQMGLHSLVLLFMVYALLKLHQKSSYKYFSAFDFSAVFIISANVLYGLDALYIHWRYSIVESLIGSLNGLYLFTLTRAAIREIKKE